MADLTDHVDELQRDLLILRQQIRAEINQLKAVAAQWEPLPCPRRDQPTTLHVQRPNQKETH